jgi:DNA repair exonuclease SbcCD nuclease subunit
MKFLHCSDLHLGKRPAGAIGDYARKRFDDYFAAFDYFADYAIANKLDAIVICGDLFDKKEISPEILSRTELILNKLNKYDIKTIAIEGNHDNINRGAEHESWMIFLEKRGLLSRPFCDLIDGNYQFSPVVVDHNIFWGLGYPGSFARETIEALAAHIDANYSASEGYIHIVLIHSAIANSEFLAGVVTENDIEPLLDKVAYIGGGHVHSYSKFPANSPKFFTPGCPEFWDINEIGKTKGAIVFDTDTLLYDFIPSKNRKAYLIKYKSKALSSGELFDEIKQKIDSLDIEVNEEVCYLNIGFENSFYPDADIINAYCAEVGFLKTFLKFDIGISDNIDENNYNSLEEIEQEIISKWSAFSNAADNTFSVLNKFKIAIAEGNSEPIIDEFDALLDQIIEGNSNDN